MFSSCSEVFAKRGWLCWPNVNAEDELACCVDGEMQFCTPLILHKRLYEGELHHSRCQRISYCVTPDHRLFVQLRTNRNGRPTWPEFRFETSQNIYGRYVRHRVGGIVYYGGSSPMTFVLPPAPLDKSNRGGANPAPTPLWFCSWLSFLAIYLADGSVTYKPERKEYRVEIGKVKDKNPGEVKIIEDVLQQLPFQFRYDQERRFIISGKELAAHMRQFGKSRDKFVPPYALTATYDERREFFDLLTTMDCSKRSDTMRVYASASKQLRDDAVYLATSLGFSTAITGHERNPRDVQFGVSIREAMTGDIASNNTRQYYRLVKYAGNVYSAQVPGGLLLTRNEGKAFWSGDA